jgi:hypothetical protein
MWKGCSTQARTCASALSTGSANSRRAFGKVDLLRKSGEFPMSYEELDDTAAPVYEGI